MKTTGSILLLALLAWMLIELISGERAAPEFAETHVATRTPIPPKTFVLKLISAADKQGAERKGNVKFSLGIRCDEHEGSARLKGQTGPDGSLALAISAQFGPCDPTHPGARVWVLNEQSGQQARQASCPLPRPGTGRLPVLILPARTGITLHGSLLASDGQGLPGEVHYSVWDSEDEWMVSGAVQTALDGSYAAHMDLDYAPQLGRVYLWALADDPAGAEFCHVLPAMQDLTQSMEPVDLRMGTPGMLWGRLLDHEQLPVVGFKLRVVAICGEHHTDWYKAPLDPCEHLGPSASLPEMSTGSGGFFLQQGLEDRNCQIQGSGPSERPILSLFRALQLAQGQLQLAANAA